jgi:hypothetical protein
VKRIALAFAILALPIVAVADDDLKLPTAGGRSAREPKGKFARITVTIPASGKPTVGEVEKDQPWCGLLFPDTQPPAKGPNEARVLLRCQAGKVVTLSGKDEIPLGPFIRQTKEESEAKATRTLLLLDAEGDVSFGAVLDAVDTILGEKLMPAFAHGDPPRAEVARFRLSIEDAAGRAKISKEGGKLAINLRIRADERAPWREVKAVLEAAADAGISRFTFGVHIGDEHGPEVEVGGPDEWAPPAPAIFFPGGEKDEKKDAKKDDEEPKVFFPGKEEGDEGKKDDDEDSGPMKKSEAEQPGRSPQKGGDALGVGGSGSARYGGRFGGRRNFVARGGGSTATESAVEAALKWLARHQGDDGRWSTIGTQCSPANACSSAAVDHPFGTTALSVLSFLGAGYTAQNRTSYVDVVTKKTMRHGEVVRKGLKALTDAQGADGTIGADGQEHALATLALLETYGITNAVAYREPASKALQALGKKLSAKDVDGWTAAWGALALGQANAAGLERPTITHDELFKAIDRASEKASGAERASLVAAGVVARLALGAKRDDPAVTKGLAALADAKIGDDARAAQWCLLAAFHADGPAGPAWKSMNKRCAAALPSSQKIRKDGCLDGAWDGATRADATALATLALETYYRYPVGFAKK